MELRQLEYFLEVVDRGSVTAAAAFLHVAQPSMSQALRRLERDLGSPLFDRVGRGMRLTSAGEALVGPARRMLREREDAQAAVAAVRGLRGGRLTIVSLPSLSIDPLAELLGQFRVTFPSVVVQIGECIQPDEVLSRVEGGECELGLTPVHRPSEHLETHEIDTQRLTLLAPRSFPGLVDPMTPDRLAALPFVCGPVGGSSRVALESMMHDSGHRVTIAVETESTEAIVPLVNAGAGVALVPRGLAFGSVRTRILSTDPAVSRRTFLVHRREMTSPAATAFVSMVLTSRAVNGQQAVRGRANR